ncbi:MAG: hypothetical protein MR902_09100 [Campylobacter sp.]|nr:hypothetical protein [Campylobacter sp.]
MRFIALILALCAFLVAEEISLEDLANLRPQSQNAITPPKRVTPSEDPIIDELKNLAPNEEENLKIDDSQLIDSVTRTKLLLTLSNVPKSVYLDQIFTATLNANIQQDINVDISLTINKNDDIELLNSSNISWVKVTAGVYQTRLWFIAKSKDAKISNISVSMDRNGEFFQKNSIIFPMPKLESLNASKNYAHIVADRLRVRSNKASNFDEASNILTLELASENGSLSSFYIDNPSVIKQGVDSLKGTENRQSGYYFAVIDKSMKELNFSYYSLLTKKFEDINLTIRAQDQTLSTQSELNPKESPFKLYLNLAIIAVMATFIVMFLAFRNTTPLIFAVLLGGFLFYNNSSYEEVKIKENTRVRILPIESSTIFFITPPNQRAEILNEHSDYYKILLDGGKIGWIKKEDIIK